MAALKGCSTVVADVLMSMRFCGFTIASFALLFAQPPEPVYINAPYVPSSDTVVSAMLKLAGVNASDIVYDLGCGDGRIVILAAKQYAARGIGIDLNPHPIHQPPPHTPKPAA